MIGAYRKQAEREGLVKRGSCTQNAKDRLQSARSCKPNGCGARSLEISCMYINTNVLVLVPYLAWAC